MLTYNLTSKVIRIRCLRCTLLQTVYISKRVHVILIISTFLQYVSYHLKITCVFKLTLRSEGGEDGGLWWKCCSHDLARLRHKNLLVMVRSIFCFCLKYLFDCHTNLPLGDVPCSIKNICFCHHNQAWIHPKISLISGIITFINIETASNCGHWLDGLLTKPNIEITRRGGTNLGDQLGDLHPRIWKPNSVNGTGSRPMRQRR